MYGNELDGAPEDATSFGEYKVAMAVLKDENDVCGRNFAINETILYEVDRCVIALDAMMDKCAYGTAPYYGMWAVSTKRLNL